MRIKMNKPSWEFSEDHGSPFDRGNADSWYGREPDPHWYPEGTYNGERVTQLTDKERMEYLWGWSSGVFNGKYAGELYE